MMLRIANGAELLPATFGDVCATWAVPIWIGALALVIMAAQGCACLWLYCRGMKLKRSCTQLADKADRDYLTGLHNRAALTRLMEEALWRGEQFGHSFGLVFVDLNRFKLVNDTCGHAVGDALLKAVARRLSEEMRVSDTVARWGGDEFVVLVQGLRNPDDLKRLCRKLCGAVARSFELDGRILQVGASCGIARYPHDGTDIPTLLRKADTRMYTEKNGSEHHG